jgi:hypothetical protein
MDPGGFILFWFRVLPHAKPPAIVCLLLTILLNL